MTIAPTLLALSLLMPQNPVRLPQSPIKLPPPKEKPGTAAPVQRPVSEIERFRRDLQELHGSVTKIENKLVEMRRSYPDLEALQLEVARSAKVAELMHLVILARRYGTTKVADELKFQLMTRPLAEATRPVVDTMVQLYERDPGADAKAALRDLIRGRMPAARRPAAELLAQRADASELPFALQLSSESSLELQLRGIELLRAIPEPGARQRLIQLLSKEPALAAAGCEALVGLGAAAVPELLALLTEPPIDRSYCYAAFALAQIGGRDGRCLLPEAAVEPLLQRLQDREALSRALAAVALADLAFYGVGAGHYDFRDANIVDALLDIVDSSAFVPNLDLLRRPAELRLVQFAGRVGSDSLGWRDWWQDQRLGFVGIRAKVVVDVDNASDCVVTLRQDRQVLRLVGAGLADADPLPGAQEVLLTSAQMLEVIDSLRRGGFGDPERMRAPSGLPPTRALQLQVRSERMQVAMPAIEHAEFTALAGLVQQVVQQELWQLFRHPASEPQRGAFWRQERAWLDENADPVARGSRLLRRVFRHWESWTSPLKARALEELFARSDRRQLLAEEDGQRILQIVQAANDFGETELALLQLAAAAPGDTVWRACLDHAARINAQLKPGSAPTAPAAKVVRAVFAVLGPDAVLSALQDQGTLVRRAAIDEVVRSRDLRAAPRLVELLVDPELEVRLKAVAACGQLQVAAAARPLVELIAAEDTQALLRREALRALGRVGGPQAFAVLERAVTAPAQEDKEAALRGLGELRDPRAAHLLAELVVAGHGKDIGQQARFHLQRQGALAAVPALRHQMDVVQEPAIRVQLVLLLGSYQDARTVPDLIDLLRQPQHAGDAALMLTGTTGFDLLGQSDRIGAMDAWWRRQKANPQWMWLLDGLQAAEVPTVLRPEAFGPGAGNQPVLELARLLSECPRPQLRVLTAAVLRSVTGVDYGAVTMQTTVAGCEAVAARYRMLVENERAAQGR